MIKNKALFLIVLILSSVGLVQFAEEQGLFKEHETVVMSQEEVEGILDVVNSFDEVMQENQTLEDLIKKMAQAFMKLKKIKESYATQEEMQYSQELKNALDELDEIYDQCEKEIKKILRKSKHDTEAILHMLLVKVLA
jgi:TolA-binding protein